MSKICQVVVLAVIVGMIVTLKPWLGRRGPIGPTTSQLHRTGLPSPVAAAMGPMTSVGPRMRFGALWGHRLSLGHRWVIVRPSPAGMGGGRGIGASPRPYGVPRAHGVIVGVIVRHRWGHRSAIACVGFWHSPTCVYVCMCFCLCCCLCSIIYIYIYTYICSIIYIA